MASHRHTKTSKQRLQGEEAQGTSSIPAKRSRKAHHSSGTHKASQSATALAKEELKRHKAIEKAIQKAIKEVSLQERAIPSPQSAPLPGPSNQPSGVHLTSQAPTLALFPDGDPSLATVHQEVNVALFGSQADSATPKPDPPEPQGNPAQVGSPLAPRPLAPEALITPDLATCIQEGY